jgi:hypothetical protein
MESPYKEFLEEDKEDLLRLKELLVYFEKRYTHRLFDKDPTLRDELVFAIKSTKQMIDEAEDDICKKQENNPS